MIQFERT